MESNRQIEEKIYVQRRRRFGWIKRRNISHQIKNSLAAKVYSPIHIPRAQRFLSIPIRTFISNGYVQNKYRAKTISVPEFFSFKHDHNGSMVFFKALLSSYFLEHGNITIDFSKCKHANISNFVLLDLFLRELYFFKEKYNEGQYHKNDKWFKIKPSKDIKILKYLHAFNLHHSDRLKDLPNTDSYLPLTLQKGRLRGAYYENPKGLVSKKVVAFVNESMAANGHTLNTKGQSLLNGLMSEVLSNAEDHSIKNSEWFVNGVAFREKQHEKSIVELNLSIVNYGDSMYEGFEKTKEQNATNYNKVNAVYAHHKALLSSNATYSREGLFTMLMLNEGISRLKYEEPSRGNGTMNFLDAFITFGQFGQDNTKFNSQLNIISGHTVLTCDNTVRPYQYETFKVISLNKSQDQSKLPDNKYLHEYDGYFPGTILECRIYLNKEYLKKIATA